jgi:hypothetical protein
MKCIFESIGMFVVGAFIIVCMVPCVIAISYVLLAILHGISRILKMFTRKK